MKRTIGEEMGQDKVTDVLKLKRNGKTVYRVEIEGADRAKTVWVDEDGRMLRELNDTEEGRVRINFNELPGNVKSAMINEAHNQEPKRIWQVTRGRDTQFVGEANDGHLVRIDSDGRVISHDTNPKVLSDNPDNRNRNLDERNRNRNRDNEDKKYEPRRDLGKLALNKIDLNDLPRAARETVRDNLRSGEKISAVYKTKPENGNFHYIIKTSDDRVIRVGEQGGLLGQTR